MISFCNSMVVPCDSVQIKKLQQFKKYCCNSVNSKNIPFSDLNDSDLITIKLGDNWNLILLTGQAFFVSFESDNYIQTKFRFSEWLYSGTIFSGEFQLNQKGVWTYYLSDIKLYNNKCIVMSFQERLELMYTILHKEYKWDEFMNICFIDLKPFFYKDYYNSNFNLEVYCPTRNSNVVVDCIDNDSENDSNQSNSKPRQVTIVRQDSFDNSKMDNYLVMDDNNKCLGQLAVITMDESRKLFQHFKRNSKLTCTCNYNTIKKKWFQVSVPTQTNVCLV